MSLHTSLHLAALVSLAATVATTYVTIRTTEERLRITHENVRVQQDNLRIAQARFDFGETSERDVVQAASQLADTQAQIPPLEVSLAQGRNALAALLGLPPDNWKPDFQRRGPFPLHRARSPRESRATCCASARTCVRQSTWRRRSRR